VEERHGGMGGLGWRRGLVREVSVGWNPWVASANRANRRNRRALIVMGGVLCHSTFEHVKMCNQQSCL
jgi:hypothetical protein